MRPNAAAQLALTNWLTLKLRVARLDLQARLVPDWEAARDHPHRAGAGQCQPVRAVP
ncbi:MAG: hypothetical protein HZY76_23100 [Anaerolineae bacterium]|nr:MAG: hypothetical protein HZY76_23100 [Anaerolineae bacterium]